MSLEIKRLELGLLKIAAVKAELELKIAERLEDIKRIEEHLKLQDDEEIKIKAKIKDKIKEEK